MKTSCYASTCLTLLVVALLTGCEKSEDNLLNTTGKKDTNIPTPQPTTKPAEPVDLTITAEMLEQLKQQEKDFLASDETATPSFLKTPKESHLELVGNYI